MSDVLTRIRQIFNQSGKNQTEIGKKIGKTSQYVWKLLNDDSANPSDSVIRDICREFNINEEWLRTGKEPMQKPIEDKLSAYVSEITDGNDELIKDFIITYMELDQSSKDALKKVMDSMLSKKMEREQH